VPAEVEHHAGADGIAGDRRPAPRAVTGTPSARHTSSTTATSSASRGAAISSGGTRYSEASEEYSARVVPS
jgi:hypothetical protein